MVTAIAKYHMTELGRDVVNSAMDIQAGKAIQRGPQNTLASALCCVTYRDYSGRCKYSDT